MSSAEELTQAITDKGEEIRLLKIAKPATLKDDLKPLVAELLALKANYKLLTGEDFGGEKKEEVKKTKAEQESEKPKEGPSKSELNKEKRKAEKAAKKAEAKAEVTAAAPPAAISEGDAAFSHLFGDYPLIQSSVMSEKAYRHVRDLSKDRAGQNVWIRARVSNSRGVGKGCFLLLRQNINSVQAVMFQGENCPKSMVKYASAISLESVVDIYAEITVPEVPIQSATVKDIELNVIEIHVVSRAGDLPFLVDDAGRGEAEAAATSLPVVNQDTALNYRWIDTRTPANQAIFRIQSGVCQLFRNYFLEHDFVEIHTPKLIGGASEGGANVFTLKYFDQPACLAQSPQFYKQITAACGGFERVFEIGPVFRAEN